MVTKKPKGLGLGLEALLGPKVSDAVAAAMAGVFEADPVAAEEELGGMGLLAATRSPS